MKEVTTNKMTVEEILKDFPNRDRGQLIPILQKVQKEQQYLSLSAMKEISKYLNLPISKIYGVATFYNQFRFQPLGKYQIQICRGTACHVQGSLTILEILKSILKINPGETTKDGLFSLEVVACIGACGLAPVVAINGEFFAKLTADKIRSIITDYKNMERNNEL